MNGRNNFRRNTLRYCALLVLPLTLAACGKARTLDWSQEALLHDGRTLWVERHSERGSPFPGNSGLEIGQTLAFRHPETGERIEWRIPEGLQPVMLDFDQGVPYYVLDTYVSSDYSKWGCPNPPWLVYRYQQGKWKRVDFGLLPAQFAIQNLMRMSKDARGLVDGGRVSVDQMEAYFKDGEQGTKKFRLIEREKLDPRRVTSECSIVELVAQGRESEIDEETWARAKKEEERFSREVKPEDQVFLKKKWAKETETAIKELKQRLEIEK